MAATAPAPPSAKTRSAPASAAAASTTLDGSPCRERAESRARSRRPLPRGRERCPSERCSDTRLARLARRRRRVRADRADGRRSHPVSLSVSCATGRTARCTRCDVLRRALERRAQRRGSAVERGAAIERRGTSERSSVDAVQFSGESTQGVVAVATNPRDDARGRARRSSRRSPPCDRTARGGPPLRGVAAPLPSHRDTVARGAS